MRETYQNILNIILIIFILAAAILFYRQQKTINQLSNVLKNQNIAAVVGKNAETKAAAVDPIDRAKIMLEANTKAIIGRLVSISENKLTVEADILDWQKMKEPRGASESAPTYKKTFTVTINTETKFTANKMDSLKAGDTIYVLSKEPVYQTDKLTAVEIASPFEKPSAPGQ
jgi:hypothetical protein